MSADGFRQMRRPQSGQDTVLWCRPNITGNLPTVFTCHQAPPRFPLPVFGQLRCQATPGMAPRAMAVLRMAALLPVAPEDVHLHEQRGQRALQSRPPL